MREIKDINIVLDALNEKINKMPQIPSNPVEKYPSVKDLDFNNAPLGWCSAWYSKMPDMKDKHAPHGPYAGCDNVPGKAYIIQTIGIVNWQKIQYAYEIYSNHDAMYQRTFENNEWSQWYCQIGTDMRSSPTGNA